MSLSTFFLRKYNFSGNLNLKLKALFGHILTHFKHLMHLLFAIPSPIALKAQCSVQISQLLQFAFLDIFKPSLLLNAGNKLANGFLYDFGITTFEGFLIFSTSGIKHSKSQKASSLSM